MTASFSHDATIFTFMGRRARMYTLARTTVGCLLAVALAAAPAAAVAGSGDSGKKHHLIDRQRIEELKQRIAELKDKHKDHRGAGNGGSTQGLQALVTDLQNQVASLSAANASLVTQLQAAVTELGLLSSRLSALESNSGGGGSALASLAKYVTVDTNTINGVKGPHIIFTGANIHIRSGKGATDDGGTLAGLGNLIVGYNELPNPVLVPDIGPCDRALTGSHNIVVGTGNVAGSYGGLVTGTRNCLSGAYANVLGGTQNEVSGPSSTILGGFHFVTFNPNQTVPTIR